MDLDHAIQKHTEWKMRLRSAISEQATMDTATISSDNCCEFGKWLHGEGGSKHGGVPSFADCVSKHAAFHKEAGKVATAINAKKFVHAETMIGSGSPFANASSAVGVSIIRLKKDAAL